MTDLKNIEKLANQMNNDMETVAKELKRIQSVKCRLKKQKGKTSYEKDMTKVLIYEQSLKEVKLLLEPKHKTVTTFEQEDIDILSYEETIKAIRSIQSKKSLSKWLTDKENDNDDYRNACIIEKMLLEHKDKVSKASVDNVKKTQIQEIIDTLENNTQLSKDKMIEYLKKLI